MDPEVNWTEPSAADRVPSVLAIYAALLAAAGAFTVMLAMLFGSFVLFAVLIDLRIPVTVALGSIAALFVERAVVYQFTAWRPPMRRLFISGLLAGPVSLAIASELPWNPWVAIPTAAAGGLLVQAFVLSFLSRS